MNVTNTALFLFSFIFIQVHSATADVVKIGTLAELSGPYARLGEDCRKGYEVAKKGAPSSIQILFGDSQSNPKVGLTEFRRMVNGEKASVIVTTRSPVALALNPLSLQQKIPLIGVVGHPRFTRDNQFAVRVYPSAFDEAEGLVAALGNEPALATINVEDEYFLGLRDSFHEMVGRDKIVFSETVSPLEQEFSSIINRVKVKNPTAILLNVAPTQIGPVLKSIRNVGLRGKLFSNFLIGAADIRSSLGPLAEGIVFVESDYHQPLFLKTLRELNGSSDTSPIGYGCYVGLTYALQLMEGAAARGTPLLDNLSNTSSVTTLDGVIAIRNREAKFQIITRVVKQGRAVIAKSKL
jgi:branched-chain amino acid transport system substrate-binding protein